MQGVHCLQLRRTDEDCCIFFLPLGRCHEGVLLSVPPLRSAHACRRAHAKRSPSGSIPSAMTCTNKHIPAGAQMSESAGAGSIAHTRYEAYGSLLFTEQPEEILFMAALVLSILRTVGLQRSNKAACPSKHMMCTISSPRYPGSALQANKTPAFLSSVSHVLV